MSTYKGKEYGLIIPSKDPKVGAPVTKKTTNVFGDDSDDDQSNVDWVKQALKKQSQSSMQQKQSTLMMKKALVEDPSVYQYDELYDEMEKKRTEVKEKAKANRQAKYMPALLEAAERRNREHEQRIERQVQKEREAEKDQFDDKDVFVTGAYRKKMEEAQRLQEEQDRKDAIDDLTDVTKQKDMSGFYRHLYRQTMEEEDQSTENSAKETPAVADSETIHKVESPSEQSNLEEREKLPKADFKKRREHKEEEELHQQPDRRRRRTHSRSPHPKDRYARKERDGREREDSRYSGSRHRERDDRRVHRSRSRDSHRRDRHRRRTPDSDRYRHRANRSRSRSGDRNRNRGRYFDRVDQTERGNSPKRIVGQSGRRSPTKIIIASEKEKDVEKTVTIKEESNQNEEEIIKTSIWTKRTVGAKYTEALARYFRRKQENPVIPATVTAT